MLNHEAVTQQILEVSGSGPVCQSGYRSGDL